MIPTQYLLLARISAYILLAVALFGTGYHYGAKGVQTDWDVANIKTLANTNKLISDNAERVASLQQAQATTNLKVSNDHETELTQITAQRDAAIAYSNSHGGLRVTRAVCSSAATARTEATSDSRHDATVTGTVALPERTSSDLLRLAADADKVTAQARALQQWIIDNGFYGPVQNEK